MLAVENHSFSPQTQPSCILVSVFLTLCGVSSVTSVCCGHPLTTYSLTLDCTGSLPVQVLTCTAVTSAVSVHKHQHSVPLSCYDGVYGSGRRLKASTFPWYFPASKNDERLIRPQRHCPPLNPPKHHLWNCLHFFEKRP